MQVEHHFADLSRYPKNSDTATSIDDVEWFAKNVGITNLDDPSVKIKTIIEDVNECELARQKARKAREAKAQDEFLDAMFNLNNGTAVLRQTTERAKPSNAAKSAKPKTVRPAAPPKRKYAPRSENVTAFDKEKAATRRTNIMQTLKSGGKIEYKQQQDCEGGYAEYQTQYTDIRWLKRVKKLDITRIQNIDSGQSYFVLDDFERYDIPKQISGYLNDADSKQALMTALLSKQMVCAKDITATNKAGARSVATLASTYGIDVYTVFDSRNVSGWIAIDKPVEKDAQ